MIDVCVDTSIAVPLVLASHRQHELVINHLSGCGVRLPAHARIETYSVLTRLPGDARLTGADAHALIADRFGSPVMMSDQGAEALIERLAAAGVVGGAVYDGMIGLTAAGAGLRLVTRDRRAAPTLRALGVDHELMLH